MATKNIEQKLAQIVENKVSTWKQDAEWRRANRKWLNKSAAIAMQVLDRLDELDWSQKQLAEKLGTTPQYISKLCKGHENLTLKNIAQLEDVLQISLVTETPRVIDYTSQINVQFDTSFMAAVANLMKRINIQFDETKNQVHVSTKASTTCTMPLKTNNSNSVKKEIEDFAMCA